MPVIQKIDSQNFNPPEEILISPSQNSTWQDSRYPITTSITSSTMLAVSKPVLRSGRSSRRTSLGGRDSREKKWRASDQSRSHSPINCYHQSNRFHHPLIFSSYNIQPYYSESQKQSSYFPLQLSTTHTENIDRSDAALPYTPRSHPPQTVHYWTSHSTRRLEYAAIDAASSGVRGFLIRLVPDCILPADARRTRLWRHDEDENLKISDKEGSVRRYRLVLPEVSDDNIAEETVPISKQVDVECRTSKKRPGLLRRWSSGLGFSRR